MKHLQYFLILTFFSITISCSYDSGLNIVNNQKSNYLIVIPNNPDTSVSAAANALQKYIQDISGSVLPIKDEKESKGDQLIWVGFPDTNLENQSIHSVGYKTSGNQLYITGGSPKSTLYAVYEFLENELGVRFYSPEVTFTPSLKHLSIKNDLNYKYTPPITTRTVHSRLFYQDPDFADKHKVTREGFPDYVPGARVHTFHRFVPGSQYFEAHPEYFALRNGKRLTTQLCLTNPTVLELVKNEVSNLFDEYPSHSIISVSQDDNTQYCQCNSCSALHAEEESPAGSMIAFVNEVAKSFPNKTISTLAYQYTRKAPKNIKPEKNVLITLCSIECDRSASIKKKCPDFARDLEDWGKLTENIRIWDYTTQFTNFLAPFPNMHTLRPNIQLFKNNNAKWIFEQHSSAPSELFELRSYLTAKLLWDPELKATDIIGEFLTGYYEAAAPYINNYITTIHEEIEKDSTFFLFLYGDPSQGFRSFLNAENLTKYNQWFDQAEQSVITKPEILKRVKIARLSIDYASLEAARKGLSSEYSISKNKDNIEQKIRNFKETLHEADITMMNEMRYSVQEYLDMYEKTIARSGTPNIAIGKTVTLNTAPKKYAGENPQTLTDNAFGGANFYSNWLGFEGNDLDAIIDIGRIEQISGISTAFLQVVNHIVFFPTKVTFYSSIDGKGFKKLGEIQNASPLEKNSKINDIQYFNLEDLNASGRYIKIVADNMDIAPDWHHGAGLPAWIFIDEVMVN